MNRRNYLTTLAGAASLSLTGCTGSDDTTDKSADTTNENDESERTEIRDETEDDATEPVSVNPEVIELAYPSPNAVSLNDEYDNNTEEYFVEIQNTGAAGQVEYTLVWLEDQSQSSSGPNSVVEVTQERFFDEGERREVSVIAERPDGYDAYGFRLHPGEITVEVENSGGDGRVAVQMMEGSQIVEDRELLMESGNRETVTFDTGDQIDWEELHFEAKES